MNHCEFFPAGNESRISDDVLKQGQPPRRANRYSKLALLAERRTGLPACQPMATLGLIVGTSLGPHESTSQVHNDMMDFGDAGVSPTAFSHSVHNVAAAYIAQALNIHGPCLTVTDFEDVATRCRQLAECWLAEGVCDTVLVVVIDEAGFVFDKIGEEFGAPFAGIRETAQAFLLTKGST